LKTPRKVKDNVNFDHGMRAEEEKRERTYEGVHNDIRRS